MGIFDEPTWHDDMLWTNYAGARAAEDAAASGRRTAAASEEAAHWARKTAQNTKRANKLAAAAAYYAKRTASSTAVAAEFAIRQEAKLGQIYDLQRLNLDRQAEHNDAVQKLQQQMLDAQLRTGWMQYRQTDDGKAFVEWAKTAARVLDVLDRMNDKWLSEFRQVVQSRVSQWEWHAERTGDYLPPSHPSKSALLKAIPATLSFAGKKGTAKFATKHLLQNPRYAEENNAIRLDWHRRRSAFFGCDPVINPDELPPGWARDDLNWSIPTKIREFMEEAYRTYPTKDTFLRNLPRIEFIKPEEARPQDLAPLIEEWAVRPPL